jgi:hypothetical protein
MKTEKISEKSKEETVDSISMEPNNIQVELSEEEQTRMEEVKSLVEAESLDPTTSMNILINAVQLAFDSDVFNDLDRYLIAKSLNCFKSYVEKGEDILLKVSE